MISNSNRNNKTNRNSSSGKLVRRIIVIVIVTVTAYEDAAFWSCGARNAVSTLAAALSAHEYCRLQHLCVDVFLDVRLSFFLFDARLLFLDVRSLVTGKLVVVIAPVIVVVPIKIL